MTSYKKNTFLEQFIYSNKLSIQHNRDVAIQLRQFLDNNGALLLKNIVLNNESFGLLSQSISLNKKVSDSLVEFGSPQAKDAPLFNVPNLPLHTDGVMIQKSTDVIIFYAQHVTHNTSGDLILSNHNNAFKSMPISMKNILINNGLEYFVLDRSPFPFLPEGWFSIPSFRNISNQSYLYLALPFELGQSEFWQVRVKGMTSSNSEKFLSELKEYLMQDDFFIRHSWESGDLVIVDNRQVFHGFHATNSDTDIYLFRQNITLL